MGRLVMNRSLRLRSCLVAWLLLAYCCLGTGCSPFGAATTTTKTLTGSSAHWNAKYVVLVRTLLNNGDIRWRTNLEVWWTGPSDNITKVLYKLSGPQGMGESGGLLRESNRWMLYEEGGSGGALQARVFQDLLLTITWKDQTETMSLGIIQDQTAPLNP